MNETARRYGCINCHSQVIICRDCDRGNRYCKQCAPVMHLKARRRAGIRYQDSHQGRLNHAARQRRYRERVQNKVTHKGSSIISLCDVLENKRKSANMKPIELAQGYFDGIFCDCCCTECSPFLRLDTLKRTL
ncbi:MAG: hypothetical protein ACI88H_001204 [Cocleimonas sp.]|jgi:hypothetical protein